MGKAWSIESDALNSMNGIKQTLKLNLSQAVHVRRMILTLAVGMPNLLHRDGVNGE